MNDEEASAQATSEDLDQYITVAPFALYAAVEPAKHAAIQNGTRLGTFPVPSSPHGSIPAGFIDFKRMTTVHQSLASRTTRRAALSPTATAHLQNGLAMHFAYRSLTNLAKLEAAIGQTIASIVVTSRSKEKIVVNLGLSDGASLTLESRDTQQRAGQAVRPARG